MVNNAAILYGRPLLDLTADNIEKGFRVNLLSHFHIIRDLLPDMLEEGRGTIVTIASVLGYIGVANLGQSPTLFVIPLTNTYQRIIRLPKQA